MGKIRKLSLYLFLLLIGCGKAAEKKPDKQEILTKVQSCLQNMDVQFAIRWKGKRFSPPLNEIFMKKIKVIREGKEIEVVADQEYL